MRLSVVRATYNDDQPGLFFMLGTGNIGSDVRGQPLLCLSILYGTDFLQTYVFCIVCDLLVFFKLLFVVCILVDTDGDVDEVIKIV